MKKERFLERLPGVSVLASLCCIMWGSAFPSIKTGYRLLQIDSTNTSSILLFAGSRFLLAGFLVIVLGSILQKKVLLPSRESLIPILVLSFCQTSLHYLFFYVGLAHTAGVKASIINGTGTFLTILFAALIFRKEKLTARKLIGCAVGFVGVILVNLTGASVEAGFSVLGEGFILMSATMSALSSGFIKIFTQKENAVMLSGYQFMLGGLTLMVVGFGTGGRIDFMVGGSAGLLVFLWLATISAVAYTLWGILLKYNPVSRVAIFGFMNPVSGAILSSLFLAEQASLTAKAWIALIFVCAGICIVNMTPTRKNANMDTE